MYFQLKRLKNDLENVIFCQNLAHDMVIFDNFSGQESLFLDFFKDFMELFKKCSRIVFELKRPTCCKVDK